MYQICGVNIYVEDHYLIIERFIIPSLFKKKIRCSDIVSIESESGMRRYYGKGGIGRDVPVERLLLYLKGGKRILIAEECPDSFVPYDAITREMQKEIEDENMRST